MTSSEGAVDAWRPALAACGLVRLADLLHQPPGPWLEGEWEELRKPGLGTRERWRWRLPGDPPRTLYLKRYVSTPLARQFDRVRQSTAHSRAWWEYTCAQELTAAEIAVARPVAFVEEMRGRIERSSALLVECAAGQPIDRAWPALESAGAAITRGAARHDLIVRLARFVCAFHSTGLCHRDLYLCHIFYHHPPGEAPEFTLIDLARCHRPRLRRLRWMIKDLSQLDASARQIGISRSDRLRFLLAYLGLQRGARRARFYARRIQAKSDWILQRIARHSGAA